MKNMIQNSFGLALVGLGLALPAGAHPGAALQDATGEGLREQSNLVFGLEASPDTRLVPAWTERTASILLWNDSDSDANIARQSLELAGLAFDEVDDYGISDALNEGGYELIVVDKPGSYVDGTLEAPLEAFVDQGGKLLVSYWNLDTAYTLAAALQVLPSTELSIPPSVMCTAPAHPICRTPEAIPSLIKGYEGSFLDNGDVLTPLEGAEVLARSGQGPAIVAGNEGRTLANGFLLTDYPFDQDRDGVNDMVGLVLNEISFLLSK